MHIQRFRHSFCNCGFSTAGWTGDEPYVLDTFYGRSRSTVFVRRFVVGRCGWCGVGELGGVVGDICVED